MNITVQVENLTRRFGDFVAVDDISLTVSKGEIFGFLGPNGAGKSTTIKMLTGLLTPTSGKGLVGGYDIMRESEEIKKNIGYMSQRFSLYDDLTVEENINFYSGIYGVSSSGKKVKMEWVLEMAGLIDRRKSVTKTLAGGFKQRLALGCAILHEPPIIFLDEPTSGVDPVSRRNFWNLIYDLARGGTTIFVTTHYMDEADYCNSLSLIYKGKIIAQGTPSQLKQEVMKQDVLEIEVDSYVDAMDVLSLNDIESAIFGSLIHVTIADSEHMTPEIKKILEASGINVIRINKIVPSLEDVFVSLIGAA